MLTFNYPIPSISLSFFSFLHKKKKKMFRNSNSHIATICKENEDKKFELIEWDSFFLVQLLNSFYIINKIYCRSVPVAAATKQK